MEYSVEKFVNMMEKIDTLYDRGLMCEYEMLEKKISTIEQLKAEYTSQLSFLYLKSKAEISITRMINNIKE
jgi:hypothetical protein